MNDPTNYIESAYRVIDMEMSEIAQLRDRIDGQFKEACDTILKCRGRVVVTGMGKSGHIGNKISATLASTGTPAFFVHPGEASHGDLGMITEEDVVIAISNSGETNEVTTIMPLIKRKGTPLIAMTGNPNSTLAQLADCHLNISVSAEACPLNLAPTSSTTVTLVLGDALAVALLEAKGFTEEQFALSHPGGSLGKRLLLLVADIMHKDGAVPKVVSGTSLTEALLEISNKGLGMTSIVNQDGSLLGIYTDGDLRRTLNNNIDIHSTTIDEVMSSRCKTIKSNALAAEALKIMEEYKISGLLVVDENNKPIGALNMQDLLRAGVV